MSIPISPGRQRIISRGPRFNKKPAIIVVVLVGAFLFGIFYAADRRRQVPVNHRPSEKVFDVDMTTEHTIDFLQDKPEGMVGGNEPPELTVEGKSDHDRSLEEDMAAFIERQQLDQLQRHDRLRQQFEQKQIERYETALASALVVSGFGGSRTEPPVRGRVQTGRGAATQQLPDLIVPAAAKGPQNVPSTPLPSQAQLRSLMQSADGQQWLSRLGQLLDGKAGQAASTDATGTAQNRAFIGQGNQRSYVLDETVQAPRSPYEIKTGTVITAAMISAASSDLPGDIVAQVTRHVFDTASGRFLLIPQGTKLFGQYDAVTQLGQERLLIVWNRLVFEDGETLDIQGMQGYDERGLAGFKDRVNTHFLRTLGNALLISVVNASGEALVSRAAQKNEAEFTLNLAQNFTDSTSTAFNDYLRNRLRIKPTLEIRAGFPFAIVVSKDMVFPRPFERGFKTYSTRQ